jgi:opacity protein-like surface antigen
MRTLRWPVFGLMCALTALPSRTQAQARHEEEDVGRDVMQAMLGSSRNLFVNGGLTTSGRLMLQRPAAGGERALRSEDGFNLGAGVGVDVMPQLGLRLSYTYTSSNLAFRTDDGDGSNALDIDDVGKLQSHAAAVEFIRYVLPARAPITPYGSAGFVGVWWMLDEESALVSAPTGSRQFRFGALATIGLQLRLAERVSARFEATSSTVRNPFTGNESFQSFGGVTVDEPTRVNTTDYRVAGVYYFGRRDERGRRRR